MMNEKTLLQKQTGFTIVELLVVVVVIAILAAITIVSYNGITTKATDVRIRTAVAEVEKASYNWSLSRGGAVPSGGGYGSTSKNNDGTCTGGAGGWVRANASYVCTLEEMLLADNLIPANYISGLPPNKIYGNSSIQTMMFYPCAGAAGRTYGLFYFLNSPSSQDAQDVAAVEAAGCPTTPRTLYGMRGARLLTF